MNRIQSFMQANGATTQIVRTYASLEFTATDAEATAYGLKSGSNYVLLVRQIPGVNKNGRMINKGEWCIIPAQ